MAIRVYAKALTARSGFKVFLATLLAALASTLANVVIELEPEWLAQLLQALITGAVGAITAYREWLLRPSIDANQMPGEVNVLPPPTHKRVGGY